MALSPDFTARESRNYHRPVEQGLIIKTKTNDDLTVPINKKREKTIRFQFFKRWIAQVYCLTLTRWIAIYPVDNVIQRLNNRGLGDRVWLI